MLKSLKKHSYRFVVVLLLLTTLLTFDVGRVTKVEAVATTAAIAGAALLGTGAIYLGYLALTGGTVSIPSGTGSEIQDYLKNVGQKVAYYTSGAAVYNKLYSYLRGNGVSALNNYDVTWSQSDLKDMYNDFKDIDLIQSISSYPLVVDTNLPTTNFDYTYNFINTSTRYYYNGTSGNDYHSFFSTSAVYTYPTGAKIIIHGNNGNANIINTWVGASAVRNLFNGSTYSAQVLNNGIWSNAVIDANIIVQDRGSTYYLFPNGSNYAITWMIYNQSNTLTLANLDYPPFADAIIYDSQTGDIIDTLSTDTQLVPNPNYSNNDDDNGNSYPIVPYVQLPNGGNWGFNLGDLITEIINRAAQSITAVSIGDLINQFRNSLGTSSGDYIYYSDNDNKYYVYYSNVYQGDEYITYNIDVSEQEDIIPVDLNTIQQYTDNQYLTVIKERAETFGETFGELVAFWHNCDPEIIYAFLGASIIVLLGAFIGKWGHS